MHICIYIINRGQLQSPIKRESTAIPTVSIADSSDMFRKIESILVVRLWTLLFWFFFTIGYHYWTQLNTVQTLIIWNIRLHVHMWIHLGMTLMSPLTIVDSCITHVCFKCEPIANVELHIPFHDIRLAYNMYIYHMYIYMIYVYTLTI